MKYLLMIIGYGWAAFGAFAILSVAFMHQYVDQPLATSVLIGIIGFIFPGLVVGGLGSNIKKGN